MGMYDRVMVPCPKCGSKVEFQSKTGPCLLQEFELDKVPAEILEGINACSPISCRKCGSFLRIEENEGAPYVMQVNRPVAEEQGRIPYRKRKSTE